VPKIPTSRLGRTAKFGGLVAGQGARWVGTNTANRFRSDDAADVKNAESSMAIAHEIVAQLGQMKGAAMKIGQVLSTVDFELIPESERDAFKARLAALRDSAPKVPFSRMEKLVATELGPLPRIFSEFDHDPIAAASIGQVYRARTTDGRDVAVKVQYPGIAEAVETDLRNVGMLFPLIRRLAPGLDVKAVMGELRERIGEELDYEIEAQNQRRVARAFRCHPSIVIPGVDTTLSTRRVLVTDFVEAEGFEEVRQRPEADRDRFGEIAFRFYFGLLARERLASGDPHPGNVMLARDGRVCFLDFGLMRRVPQAHLELEQDTARALLEADADRLFESLARLGYLPEPETFDPGLVLEQLQAAAAWYAAPGARRLDPEYVRGVIEAGSSPRSAFFEQMRRQTVPPESLLIRRMEGLLFASLGELRASADWHGLMREVLLGEPATTALGREEHEWLLGGAAA
jgi:predicted unusual protein kinase regulating ubiquinone biosynthesis (AarF/ABC1/UbiB family)